MKSIMTYQWIVHLFGGTFPHYVTLLGTPIHYDCHIDVTTKIITMYITLEVEPNSLNDTYGYHVNIASTSEYSSLFETEVQYIKIFQDEHQSSYRLILAKEPVSQLLPPQQWKLETKVKEKDLVDCPIE